MNMIVSLLKIIIKKINERRSEIYNMCEGKKSCVYEYSISHYSLHRQTSCKYFDNNNNDCNYYFFTLGFAFNFFWLSSSEVKISAPPAPNTTLVDDDGWSAMNLVETRKVFFFHFAAALFIH